MKRLLEPLVVLLIVAIGMQHVVASGSCTNCNWAPSSWTSVSVFIYPDSPDYAETQQSFVWLYEDDVAEKHGIKQMMIEDVWWYYEKYVLGQRK